MSNAVAVENEIKLQFLVVGNSNFDQMSTQVKINTKDVDSLAKCHFNFSSTLNTCLSGLLWWNCVAVSPYFQPISGL